MNKELQQAYKDYIAFLELHVDKSAVFLHVHGMRASQKDYEEGVAHREKIKELENSTIPH